MSRPRKSAAMGPPKIQRSDEYWEDLVDPCNARRMEKLIAQLQYTLEVFQRVVDDRDRCYKAGQQLHEAALQIVAQRDAARKALYRIFRILTRSELQSKHPVQDFAQNEPFVGLCPGDDCLYCACLREIDKARLAA